MTVSSATSKVQYNGNGSTTVFAYTFKVFNQNDLTVIVRSAAGTETVKTITTHYTVSGVGSAGGGNVTMLTAPASGETLTILREQDLTQELDLVENDPFPAQSLEDALDKLTFMVQQHSEEIDRSIKASRTNTITSTEFTVSAASRANKIFAFDSAGELAVTQELGTYRGNWATATAFAQRDIVKDTSNNNIYIVVTAHTSTGSQPISSNADVAKWALIVDAASATTSAAAAASSASAAATSETNASNSATASAGSASAASTSATNASNSASAASTSETNAAASAAAAAASFDAFDDIYLGSYASNPTVDNDGNTLTVGDQYFNSVANELRIWNGSTWQTASTVGGTVSSLEVTGVASFADGTAAAPSITNTGDTNTGMFFPAADTIAFAEGGVEVMRVDSSGNVGIGVTANAAIKLDVNGPVASRAALTADQTSAGVMAYTGTTTQLISYGSAVTGGIMDFYTGLGGVTPTVRMRIDASGNVGIGTTSPSSWSILAALGSNSTGFAGITAINSNANVGIGGIQFASDSTYTKSAIGLVRENANGQGSLVFYNDSNADAANWASGDEKMRINASGNVGIGTSSPASTLAVGGNTPTAGKVSVVGAAAGISLALSDNVNSSLYVKHLAGGSIIGTDAGGALRLGTDGFTERMFIDSSGNVMVGTTTAGGKFTLQCANAATAIVTGNASGTAAYNAGLFYNNGLSSLVGQISVSGAVCTYLSVSDHRLKENVQPMVGALDKIALLNPVTYKWKYDGSDGQGFIAHELQVVVPDCVSGEKDATDADGNPQYQGIDTSFLVATLVKGMQEQQAIITALTARIAALEA